MQSRLYCPRDAQLMQLSMDQNHSVTHCTACNGSLLHITKIADYPAIRQLQGSTGIACPVCAVHMLAVQHKGVEIDICANCDLVWLDAGERQKLQRNERWYDNLDVPDPSLLIPKRSDNNTADLSAEDGELLSAVGDFLAGLLEGISL